MRPHWLLLCLLATASMAGADDPLKSDACGRSLDALQAARADPQRAHEIEALRQQATQVCLGGTGQARRPSPVAQPPVTVAPPVIDPPPAPQPPVALPATPPVRIERPPVLTSCDAGGCWDSDGRRLNRAGPVLIGPSGPCVVSGHVVQCP